MKFLKKWQLFFEADNQQTEIYQQGESLSKDNEKANDESLKQIQKDLSYYKSKVQIMLDLFKDPKKEESALNLELQKRVYDNERDFKKRNRYLVDLESLYRMKRQLDRNNLDVVENQSRKDEIQKQMNDLRDRFNQVDDSNQKSKLSEQIEKSRKYLKQLSDDVISKKKQASQIDKNYQQKRKNFEEMMKVEENRIKDLSRK